MNINVQSVHFDADNKLIDFINTRVNKLNTYSEKITASEVILKLDKAKTNENKIVEIKIAVPGRELFAKRQCKSFEEAVDGSVEALRTQIRKHKGKSLSR
jgi:putative sigma-54 modulation protein